jgi:hypothetical protein
MSRDDRAQDAGGTPVSGRTLYWPKDAAWWRRERVTAAGLESERAPAVLDWLTCEAKAQSGPRDEHGWVKTGYAAIAHGAAFGHASAEQIRPVVSLLVRVGLLDDFEELGEGVFKCRISGWREDVHLTLEASRKARERAASRDVPARPARPAASGRGEQNSSEEPSWDEGTRRARPAATAAAPAAPSAPPEAEPDALPTDLPDRLHPAALRVHTLLAELAAAKGAQVVGLAAVGRALLTYPDGDHVGVAEDVAYWWRDGGGHGRPMRDVVQTYRNRLRTEPPATPTARPALTAVPGGRGRFDKYDRAPDRGAAS